jgi:hypothetical protein
VRIEALRGAHPSVALSRHDVRWSIEGGTVAPIPMDHASEPMGTLFVASGEGKSMLTASVELLGRQQTFELMVGQAKN